MIGAITLAWMAYQALGSIEGVASLLSQNQAGMLTSDLQILGALAPMDPTWLDQLRSQQPSLDLIGAHGDLVLTALLLSWWANKNADGGGVLVQRMLACRSPKDATLAMGWFTAVHYMIRPWAWVATGLVVGLLFSIPPASGFEQSYPDAMLSLLPNGLLGLALGGLVAALISTADTHLHWGASYLANDLLPSQASNQQRLRASRWSQPLMALIAAVIAVHLNSIAAAWKILLVLGAGLGAPTLLRWFIMRIDARSELIAFGASTVAAGLVLWGPWARPSFAWQMAIVGTTGLISCLVCTIWSAQDEEASTRFMRRTNNIPKSWWLFALTALCSMLLAAAGASRALVGHPFGLILLGVGLVSYALILRAYAHRITSNDS